MKLVVRRLRGAKSLLLAALVATVIAVSFVVGLLAYGQEVVAEAARASIAAAPPEERSLLVRGSASAGGTDIAAKDAALRATLAGGIGGRPVQTWSAGYAVGRQLMGQTGGAVGDEDGIIFANVMFLDDLPGHARLLSGDWARPDQVTTEATVPRSAAAVLQIDVGDRLPILDRRSEETTDVVVTGIWEPMDLTDPYWSLVSGVTTGVVPGGHSYGPFTLDRADFVRSWSDTASVAWVVRPDLTGVGLSGLLDLTAALPGLADLPERMGLADTGHLTTGMNALGSRLIRGDLVGRSALLTPVLLIVVLGVYALLLIALLLTEQRRGETALIRARGAGRAQIAGLTVRESALLVLPAILFAPSLSAFVLGAAGRLPVFTDIALHLSDRPRPWMWAVSSAAGVVCLAAMVGPSLRRSGTYVEELGARSRPSRFAFAQRVGVDGALVVLAAIAWLQLRQYASPLTGTGRRLAIDPLLVGAPTIGVLAGAVVSLRLLPRLTRWAERWIDRKHWPATMLGMWQAGRRPHAGPVLLVALGAAVSTLAWSMLSTAQRSIVDQADFAVGADLRLVETNGFAPDSRSTQLAAGLGVVAAAPVSRAVLRLGRESVSTALVGIEPGLGATVMHYRDDLGGVEALADLAAARPALPVLPLPAGATRLAVTATADVEPYPVLGGHEIPTPVLDFTFTASLLAADGHAIRLLLGTMRSTDEPRRFEVALPPDPVLSLMRIGVIADGEAITDVSWTLTGAQTGDATGAWSDLDLRGSLDWEVVDGQGERIAAADRVPTDPGGLGGTLVTELGMSLGPAANLSAVPELGQGFALPVLATPEALRAMRIDVGEHAPASVMGALVRLRVVGEVGAVPGTSRSPSALIADLPTLNVFIAHSRPAGLSTPEHWVAVEPGASAQVADWAATLGGLRVLDRVSQARAAGRDPYGLGGRTALFATGAGALLLALIGIAVDVRATARRRVGEFAVLQTMGAGSRLLSRAVLAEQSFLAGLGVLVGLLVGLGVAATLAPLLILTPTADRPEPLALLSVPWLPVLGTAVGLSVAAMALSGAVAATLGRRLAVARLRIGDET